MFVYLCKAINNSELKNNINNNNIASESTGWSWHQGVTSTWRNNAIFFKFYNAYQFLSTPKYQNDSLDFVGWPGQGQQKPISGNV